MSRYETKLKDKLDDEIKLAGLEALVPEELEKHVILIPSRVTRDRVDTLIPLMLIRSTLSRLAKEKGHRVRVMGVF